MARVRPRSMKDGYLQLFGIFSDFIGQDRAQDMQLPFRFLSETTEDRSLFANSQIKSNKVDWLGRHILLVSCSGSNYFITVGYHDIQMPVGFTAIDTKLGMFMAVILELKIGILPSFTAFDIKQHILIPIEDEANPIAYKFDDIVTYFPEICVFVINDEIKQYDILLDKYATLMICNNSDLLKLNIPENIIDLYKDIIDSNYSHLNYDNIWRSISAIEWRYCFIELYRCIEVLFYISQTYQLSTDLSSRLSLNNLFRYIYKTLPDTYHENTGLDILFNLLQPETIEKLKAISELKTTDGFYRLRNSIVHGKRQEYYNSIIKKEDSWKSIITFTLIAIKELYELFDDDLDQFDESIIKSNRRC